MTRITVTEPTAHNVLKDILMQVLYVTNVLSTANRVLTVNAMAAFHQDAPKKFANMQTAQMDAMQMLSAVVVRMDSIRILIIAIDVTTPIANVRQRLTAKDVSLGTTEQVISV